MTRRAPQVTLRSSYLSANTDADGAEYTRTHIPVVGNICRSVQGHSSAVQSFIHLMGSWEMRENRD